MMFPSVTSVAFSPISAKSVIQTVVSESIFSSLLFSVFYCILLQNVGQMTHVNVAAISLEYYSLCFWFSIMLWHFPHHWLTEDFSEEAIIWIQPCVCTHDSCLSLNLNCLKLWLQMFPCFSGPNSGWCILAFVAYMQLKSVKQSESRWCSCVLSELGLEFVKQLTSKAERWWGAGSKDCMQGLQHRPLYALSLVWMWGAPTAIQYV